MSECVCVCVCFAMRIEVGPTCRVLTHSRTHALKPSTMSSTAPSRNAPLLIAYISLITLAVIPIYFGSFHSLRTPDKVLEARRAANKGKPTSDGEEDEEDADTDDEPAASETLTSSDAWLFPVIGSFVLFSMYLVFKFLDRNWVDRVLGVYFGLVGTASVVKAFVLIASGAVGYKRWQALCDHKITITKRLSDKELAEERKELSKRSKKSDDSDADVPKGRIRSESAQKRILLWYTFL